MSTFERWAPWWGLIVVPAAFLGLLSANYAMVSYACRSEQHGLVHIAPALELAISALGVLLSAMVVLHGRSAPGGVVPPERRFLNAISLATAILFLIATLVQWYVVFGLSPCLS